MHFSDNLAQSGVKVEQNSCERKASGLEVEAAESLFWGRWMLQSRWETVEKGRAALLPMMRPERKGGEGAESLRRKRVAASVSLWPSVQVT